MFARVTLAEIDPVRMPVNQALRLFEESVLPELRRQDGYAGVYVLTTPEGKALLLSLWDTPESAQRSVDSGYYEAQLARFATVFRSPPGREQYEVAMVDQPVAARGPRS